MGDRANIKLKERSGNSIYLYTHWQGYEWPSKLRDALEFGKGRWDDEQYLHRIIVTHMCKNNADSLTGYGLSTYRGDNNRDVMEVDVSTQTVRKLSSEGFHDEGEWIPEVLQEWTFTEYLSEKFT